MSHWLKISEEQCLAAGVRIGDMATLQITALECQPEPDVPADLGEALRASPAAKAVWDATRVIASLDWIHWIVSAKQAKTREKRVNEACDKLASAQRSACCFDPSGFYSKALKVPEAAD